MDRSTLWPIVKPGLKLEIQISAKISPRTAKTSLICIKPKFRKNEAFSQLIDPTGRAFPYPGLAQGDSHHRAHS